MIFLLTYFPILDPFSIQDFSRVLDFSDLFCNLSIIVYSKLESDKTNNLPNQPEIIYDNVEIDRSRILSDNKGRSGIYMFKHIESGKVYVGSSVDLSKRLSLYFSKKYLNRFKRVYIHNALLHHEYAAFSLSILKYLDIKDLSKEEAQKFILEKEQNYLNLIFFADEPFTFNILRVAGSYLRFNHTTESRTLMSIAKSGKNHPLYGKTHSEKTIMRMSETHKGKTFSAETLAKMSVAQRNINRTGKNHPMIGKNGPMFGKTHSVETKALMSIRKTGVNSLVNKKVYVYLSIIPTILSHKFISCTEAAKYFSCSAMTISRYAKSGKLFQDMWILSLYTKK